MNIYKWYMGCKENPLLTIFISRRLLSAYLRNLSRTRKAIYIRIL